MKGRNSYNANAGNEYIDSNKLDGNFTPVNNSNKSVNAPKKEKETVDSIDSTTVAKKLNFNNSTTQSTEDEYVQVVYKKSRRNLDALSEPNIENSKQVSVFSKSHNNRELSGLEEEIQREQQKNSSSRRNLDTFGKEIADEQHIKNEKFAKRENYKKRTNQYDNYRHMPEPVIEKKEVNVNTNDSNLFPTLVKTTADIKKLSVWNVFNPTILEKNNEPIVIKQTQVTKLVEPINNQPSIGTNILKQNKDEDDDDEDEYYEYNSEDNDEEEDYEEEDEEIVYIREKYYKRDELINDIKFVKDKFNKKNIDHVRYLHQLECELANIEDEIYRFEDLENEMERIYGPYYRNQSSLFDDQKRIREEAEINAKRNDSNACKYFFRMLESVKT